MMKFLMTVFLLAVLLVGGCSGVNREPVVPYSEPVLNETLNVSSVLQEEVLVKSFDVSLPRNGNFTFYIFDAEGSSVFFKTPGNKSVLVDTGLSSDFDMISRTMRNLGVRDVDVFVLSRNVDEANSGVIALNSHFDFVDVYHNGLSEFVYPLSSLSDVANFKAVSLDSSIEVDGVLVEFIVPFDDGGGFSFDENDNSILVKTSYGSFSVLYASGCGLNCEERVEDSYLKSDILIAAQKGGCDASTTFFLEEVKPSVVIAQGTFCPAVKSRVDFLNLESFSTKENGLLAFTTNGIDPFLVGGEKE